MGMEMTERADDPEVSEATDLEFQEMPEASSLASRETLV